MAIFGSLNVNVNVNSGGRAPPCQFARSELLRVTQGERD